MSTKIVESLCGLISLVVSLDVFFLRYFLYHWCSGYNIGENGLKRGNRPFYS